MSNDTLLALVMHECKPAIIDTDSLEDRCRASMKAAKGHWMVTDEETQFKGAVAAVYAASTDNDEKERIRLELENLAHLAALLSGIHIDFDAVHDIENPILLRKLWQEVTR